MPQSADIQTRREELPIAGRSMELRDFTRAADADAESPLATASLVFSAGAAVRRYDWFRERPYLEQLVVEEGTIRMERMQRGAPLLNTHNSWSLEAQLGVVENPTIQGGQGLCDVTFSRRDSVAGIVQDVADGIIRNVSVGYVRHRIEMVPPDQEGGTWVYRVVDWEPLEVSLVPIPADLDCQVRTDGSAPRPAQDGRALRTFACDFIEVRSASQSPTVGATAEIPTTENRSMADLANPAGGTADQADQQRAQPAAPAAPAAAPAAGAPAAPLAADTRAADIMDLCTRHDVAHLASGMVRSGATLEQARTNVLEELARRDAASGGHRNTRVETIRDEVQTRMDGMQEALTVRLDARVQLTDNGRQYRGMSLLELGRDMLERSGVNTRGMDRMQLAGAMLQHRSGGLMSTSDFAHIMNNVASRRLRAGYEENQGTYRQWARRAPNAPDFKSINVVQLSAMPDLLKVNEHGEFKYGTMSDAGETYAVTTFGRIIGLTRQAIVNDDLRAFDRLIGGFGGAASRLENRTVYAQLTANPTMGDGTALFHASHKNLGTGAGSALALDGLKAGRTAMRLQKGLAEEELNLSPAFLIVPAALEQVAYQLTSSNYVPAKQADVNEFRTGGRTAVEAVIEPILDANSSTAWYLAASNGQVDTVEYCYLDGAEGPVIDSQNGFEVDGVQFKCRLDFAAKTIDHRGLYKANGA